MKDKKSGAAMGCGVAVVCMCGKAGVDYTASLRLLSHDHAST